MMLMYNMTRSKSHIVYHISEPRSPDNKTGLVFLSCSRASYPEAWLLSDGVSHLRGCRLPARGFAEADGQHLEMPRVVEVP